MKIIKLWQVRTSGNSNPVAYFAFRCDAEAYADAERKINYDVTYIVDDSMQELVKG